MSRLARLSPGTMQGTGKRLKRRKKLEWHKIIALLVIIVGVVIVQECFVLMYLCITRGFTSTAAWLTAAVGLAEAVMAAGATGYFNLAKSDHKEGGITFEAAKAKGFTEDSVSPPI